MENEQVVKPKVSPGVLARVLEPNTSERTQEFVRKVRELCTIYQVEIHGDSSGPFLVWLDKGCTKESEDECFFYPYADADPEPLKVASNG